MKSFWKHRRGNLTRKQSVFSGAVLDVSAATNLTDQALKSLQGKQWVLRFLNTKFEDKNSSFGVGQNTHTIEYTIVSHVTVLQLFYEIDGQSFNIGVIANKQTGDGVPDNIQPPWWYFLVVIASAIISLILLIFIVPRLIIGIFDLFDVDKFSFGTIVLTILRLVVLAFLVLVVMLSVNLQTSCNNGSLAFA